MFTLAFLGLFWLTWEQLDVSDGGIFSNSAFGRSLEDGTLVLPNPAPLPNTSQQAVPHVIVGDEAFPLRNYLMLPYLDEIFLV